jgi:threonine synthase
MRYVSTRGGTPPVSFKDAVLEGLARDGGLLLPERLPDVREELDEWRRLPFVALAARVMSRFIDDIPIARLEQILAKSYASFDHPEVVPVVSFDDFSVLELFHGPTLAFKDIALQFVGNVYAEILAERGMTLNILGATSGDTGSAAIAGVLGRAGIAIFVMYPAGRVSRLQELQMTSVLDDNVHALEIEGSFDDCQRLMKEVFNDLAFKSRFRLASFNSVNWARVLAQIVYYFYAALKLDRGGQTKVSFTVPTGNFGNILAGYIARSMGAPIDRLVCATNENDILSVFFNTGVYRRGEVHYTISPSMDIQVASNFERYLYLEMERDSARLNAFMAAFARDGVARLGNGPVDPTICAGSANTEETLATIRDVYARHGYVVDPHTAVGIAVARRLGVSQPLVCVATAHPAKFPESVDRALGKPLARHPRLDALAGAKSRKRTLPASVDAVKGQIRRYAI